MNIFGGIVNCVTIANGIVKAGRELDLKVPLVVRLEGKLKFYFFESSNCYQSQK